MIAVGPQVCFRTRSGFPVAADQPSGSRSLAHPLCFSGFQPSVRPCPPNRLRCGSRPILISCNLSRGSSGGRSSGAGDDTDQDCLPASLLLAETVAHYRMLQQGYQEVKWPISRECSIENLIDVLQGDDNQNCPDQFQFVKNLPEKIGYRMEMVRITKRVKNTYFARLYFSEPEKDELFSVDARPSDAINVAYRCQVPVYVNKQIVLTDAMKIGYGSDRTHDAKPVYDVTIDSAPEGPDVLVEELELVRNMNLAIKEERYKDAAMWRDKLRKLRKTKT